MKVKLIDCQTETKVEQFGTCDLCMHTGTARYRRFTFEDVATGKRFDVDAEMWSWGDFFQAGEIDNLARFAEWLLHNEVPDNDELRNDYGWIRDVIDEYNYGDEEDWEDWDDEED